jgi:hypothetical protein
MKIISRWMYVGAPPKWTKAELFWRALEPEYEYGLDVDRHNELLPPSQDGEHAKEFGIHVLEAGEEPSGRAV